MMDIENISCFEPKSFNPPYPWVGHLPFATWLMWKMAPKVFVELGTHYGNSYFAFCQAAQESSIDAKCFAVDTWEGEAHAGYYDNEVYDYVKNHNEKNYSQFSTLLRISFDEAVNYFEDCSIDLLHIDGLHTYEAVRHDFETWLPKVKPNGVILFHDTVVKRDDFGVWRFWSELTKEYNFTIEFPHSNGLGVLQPSNANAPDWLPKKENDKNEFIKTFAKYGELFELRGKIDEKNKEIDRHILDIKAYQMRLQLKDKEIQGHIEDIYAYRDKVLKLEIECSNIEQLLTLDIKAYQMRLQNKDKEIQAHIEDIYAYRDKVSKLEAENISLDRLLIDARKKVEMLESELTRVKN